MKQALSETLWLTNVTVIEHEELPAGPQTILTYEEDSTGKMVQFTEDSKFFRTRQPVQWLTDEQIAAGEYQRFPQYGDWEKVPEHLQ